LPGKVTKVDVKAGRCDVKPLLKKKHHASGEVTEIPVIPNVLIGTYRAGQAYISLPLKVGDYVELKFCERSIDLWATKGGTVDPKDSRRFDLTDATAYPGMYPLTDPPVDADPDNIVIKNRFSKFEIAPDGKFALSGPLLEFFQLMVDTLDDIISAQVLDPLSGSLPFNPATIAALTLRKQALETFIL
jgi:hypothetical protein